MTPAQFLTSKTSFIKNADNKWEAISQCRREFFQQHNGNVAMVHAFDNLIADKTWKWFLGLNQ